MPTASILKRLSFSFGQGSPSASSPSRSVLDQEWPSMDDFPDFDTSIHTTSDKVKTTKIRSPKAQQGSTLFLKRYHIKGTVVRGPDERVKLATDTKTSSDVAIKFVSKATKGALKDSLVRAEIASKIPSHPNICTFVERASKNNQVATVVDLGQNGAYKTLHKTLEDGFLAMDQVKHIIKQALLALQHHHKHGGAHRDVSPSSILLCGPSASNAKLCCFGLVNQPSQDDHANGMAAYRAPEERVGPAMDVFSLGVCLFQSAVSFRPWQSASCDDILYGHFSLNRKAFWKWAHKNSNQRLDKTFESLFNGMCTAHPQDRLSPSDCLAHPFFVGVNE